MVLRQPPLWLLQEALEATAACAASDPSDNFTSDPTLM